MQSATTNHEIQTIKPLNITHEMADQSNQKREAFVARDLKDNISFRLEIQNTSITGEFAKKGSKGEATVIDKANFFLDKDKLQNASPKDIAQAVATLVNLGLEPAQIGEMLHSLNK